MRTTLIFCALFLTIAIAAAGPIVRRAAEEDISPLNEVYVFQNEDDPALNEDGEHGDREKRKIGVIKLGVSNGIINFVFGKLDAFLDAKTRAISVLDEGNKAKNAAFGIDNTQSATSQFIGNLVSQKIQAGTASIGPVINSATTFLSGATSGLAGAFASKLAPLSSIAGSLSAGAGSSGGSSGGAFSGGGSGSILGSLLSGLSSGSGGIGGIGSLSAGSSGGDGDDSSSSSGSSSSAGAGAGINLGAFANLGGGEKISTTTEDIPEFDRSHVSLAVPAPAFGPGFTLLTNISKVFSKLILNSALRTQSVLEALKPFFRGAFAIKGLPSDRPK